MELFRQEYESKLPPNYGKITFERILERKENEQYLDPKPISDIVLKSYQDINIINGNVINVTLLLEYLNNEQLCEFFCHLNDNNNKNDNNKNENIYDSVILQGWKKIDDKVLRSISMNLGETLHELDLSYSNVKLSHLEILLARVSTLRILKIHGCDQFDASCMNILARVSASAMIELYADNNNQFHIDPLLIMGGCVGFHAPKLTNLIVLSLATCPLADKGLLGLKNACKKLEFLNLCNCSELTDTSVVPLIKANKHLTVVNISNCILLTNAVAIALSKCIFLTSLNASKLLKITDQGIIPILTQCVELQALNISGLRKLTEESLCTVAYHCKNLATLNITGCEKITQNGLNAIIEGFCYVTASKSYLGFKPVDNYLEMKLQNHLNGIKDNNASTIQRFFKSRHNLWSVKEEYRFDMMTSAATRIQLNTRAYFKRLPFYYSWVERKRIQTAMTLQRVYRGFLARCKAWNLREEQEQFKRLYPYALAIQKVVRGHKCRRTDRYIATAIRAMYRRRLSEAIVAISVRFQSCGRRFLARKKAEAWKEVRVRRTKDEFNSILILQCVGRCYNARIRLDKIRAEAARIADLQFRCATRIQRWMSKMTNRHRANMSEADKMRIYKREWAATLRLQKVYRGFKGREKWNREKIKYAREYYAATQIQRIFRGCLILQYKDLRLNIISAYVLDRHYVERQDSIAASRHRYRMFLQEVQRDSASEPDAEEEEPPEWTEFYDKARGKPYWHNAMTAETTYDEPLGNLIHERAMLYKRIRVFWVVQGVWYEGIITDFHRRKKRHRIQYDDGDHEWLNLEAEYDRIQIQLDDGSWVMYTMYKPPETLIEMDKINKRIEEANYKEIAYKDAQQWKLIPADGSNTVMFMSETTGELRCGVHHAANWLIQDDGFGYPCFYNLDTEEIVHEDPRFEEDVSADLQKQRNYVLSELRFAMYFISDLYRKYEVAVEANDTVAMNYAMTKIRLSPKLKHLNAFLIRAKGLYVVSSVVDKPLNAAIEEELTYAQWISERVAEIIDQAEIIERANQKAKKEMVAKFRKSASEPVFCKHCTHETKRHLEFCPTCGKRQIY